MNPATEILNQLGGKRFIAMTGSNNFRSDNDNRTLVMNLRTNKSKAKYLTITLNGMDTYDMTFQTMKNKPSYQIVEIKKLENVYVEDLQKMFTDVTGLYTHL